MIGKYVPESRPMGITTRNTGRFMWSIVGTSAVKQSPKAANPQPARKAIGSVAGSHARWRSTRPSDGEDRQDEADDQHVDRRQEGGPEHLAPDDVPQLDLGRELALPGPLVAHPDERREERLEHGRHEGRVGEEPRRHVGGVVHGMPSPVQRPHVAAQAQPEGEEHRHRLADGRQERGVPVVEVHAEVPEDDDAALPLERRGAATACRDAPRPRAGGSLAGHGSSASFRNRSSSVGLRTS